jgi:hypothetical protein
MSFFVMCHPRTWHWRPLTGYKSLEKNQGWRESEIGLLGRFVHVVKYLP